ncbi:MAG: hypothetical protein HYY03_04725 [Chloroflexi bacterium]|nr:hypothetical protein [Chloroflexota bacterium]
MGFFRFFTSSPLGIVVGVVSALVLIVIVFVIVVGALAFTGGPGDCTPGGGPIELSAANSDTFRQKWDGLDATLDGGSPASATLTESEVASRADRYLTVERDTDFSDVLVCIHAGFGEGTAKVSGFLGLDVRAKVKGNVDLSGPHPVAQIDDIEVGNVPGFLVEPFENLVENAIDEALDGVNLKHTYAPTLSEGQAQINGTP